MDIKRLSSDFPICAPIDFSDDYQLENLGVKSIVRSRPDSEVDFQSLFEMSETEVGLVSLETHYAPSAPYYLSLARSNAILSLANL
jgi:protein tyrosine phosphatase (PTP) superfamily phosphohydrolase (DUF442 family)